MSKTANDQAIKFERNLENKLIGYFLLMSKIIKQKYKKNHKKTQNNDAKQHCYIPLKKEYAEVNKLN